MAANASGAAPAKDAASGSGSASPPAKSNESGGLTGVVVITGGITLLMYLQIVSAYKFLHKRHPHIFKKPKLPPFEVMRQRVQNSKLVNKLKQMAAPPQGAGVNPAAAKPNGEANYSGRVNQGYVDDDNQEPNLMDEDNQQRSGSSRASTGPRLRTARRPNWADRARKVNRLMRVNNAAQNAA